MSLERCCKNNSPSVSGFMYVEENEVRLANHHHFLRSGEWEVLCMYEYVCRELVQLYYVTEYGKVQPKELVWSKFMHNNFSVFSNASCYVCAPICTSFQSLSAETLGASRVWYESPSEHFVNTPTQRKVKPLKSVYEREEFKLLSIRFFYTIADFRDAAALYHTTDRGERI